MAWFWRQYIFGAKIVGKKERTQAMLKIWQPLDCGRILPHTIREIPCLYFFLMCFREFTGNDSGAPHFQSGCSANAAAKADTRTTQSIKCWSGRWVAHTRVYTHRFVLIIHPSQIASTREIKFGQLGQRTKETRKSEGQ